jgi:hypothetical protein
MIKLKEILLEGKPPTIFVPRRLEDRVERMISLYVRNGNKGNLDLSGLKLTKLPEILKNVSIGGDFDCGFNNLTSLENCPSSVDGTFGCGNNNLTSLEGSPSSVGGSFICGGNNLTSLEGAPKFVGGDFYCTDNPVQFTRKGVKSVCNVKGHIFV